MLGNFFGDFVKGSELSHLDDEHQIGVRLHRKIDSYTDSHSDIKALRTLFPRSIRRMSGVVIDIYFDHLLCAHWDRYTGLPLDELLQHFYAEVEAYPYGMSERYQQVKRGLLDYRWLSDYQDIQSCERSFKHIEKRLGGRILFAEQAMHIVQHSNRELNASFLRFYPQLVAFADNMAKQLAAPEADFLNR